MDLRDNKNMKVTKAELEAFKLTLPEGIRKEFFRWLVTDYCVPTALFLIKQKALELGNVDVALWSKSMGMAGPQSTNPMSFHLLNGVNDVEAMKENINPDIPIIIVEHPFKEKGKRVKSSCSLIIDGNKRLRKAFLQQREKVQAYYLPKELAKLCVI